ncbi:hypothetical protein ECANGB1_866 [Enterospora canceri]|uniref:Uncharacterized protein n=1 Tax=Enterospora canceri TaxID=1081671 RepID=A0A1Y1S8G9_9MICR|nr:hypothetical protein ECANGB1_866 [Enterospora canceri]
MSKTFKDKKITRGQIQKKINEENRKEAEKIEAELREAERWYDPKRVTKCDIRKVRDIDTVKKKEILRKKYEEEYNNM